VRDARPEGREHGGRRESVGRRLFCGRRGPGAVGNSRIVAYGARSPVWRLSAKHALNGSTEVRGTKNVGDARIPHRPLT